MNNETVISFEKKCTNCGTSVIKYEELSLRRGGFLGFFSDIGAIFEKHFTTKYYKCDKCGHLDFYQDNK